MTAKEEQQMKEILLKAEQELIQIMEQMKVQIAELEMKMWGNASKQPWK